MYMTIKFSVDDHAVAYPSNVLSQRCGHIFNILLGSDTDNGNIVAAGDWAEFDVFEEAAPTSFKGKVVEKMPSGNYLVLVTEDTDGLLVYQKPLNPDDSRREFKKESAMYNEKGSICRCYSLTKFDRFEASALAFSKEPEVGDTITGVANKKMVVAE